MPADVGVDECCSGCLDLLCERDDVVPPLAAFDEIGHRQSERDHEVGAGGGADTANDLDGESAAVGGSSAPFVGAPVGSFGEELVDEIPFTAHDFDAVVAGYPGEPGAPHERADLPPHPPRGEPARPERVDGRLDRRCGHAQRPIAVAAGVQDLQEDSAALVVHGVGDSPVSARFDPIGELGAER